MPHRSRFRALSIAATAILALLGSSESSRSDSGDAARSAQGTSTFALEMDGRTIDVTNVTFMTTGSHVPGRPEDERLLLRTTTRTRKVIDEKGLEATVTVDAWPLGTDPAGTPIYAVKLDGVDARVEDNAVIVFERGTEDVTWQSIHSLGTGAWLFDTFVPLWRFRSSEGVEAGRYVGFDVPPDNAPDERLRDPRVVGILSFASPEHPIHRLLFTCSDAERAAKLRSYWDTTRSLSFAHNAAADPPAGSLIMTWYLADAARHVETAEIPFVGDDLNVAAARVPECMTIAPWGP